MEIRAEGTLVCGTPAPHYRMMELEEIRAKLRPLVISEIDTIERGDKYLFKKTDTICSADLSDNELEVLDQLQRLGHVAKILLMPDEFDRDDLMAIAEGRMENGDHVCL